MNHSTIDFSSFSSSEVVSMYVEFCCRWVNFLSIGNATERKPYQGATFLDSLPNTEVEKKIEESYPALHNRYVIVRSPEYAVVPRAYFKEELKESYLDALVSPALEEEKVYCDYWEKEELYLIYRIPAHVSPILKLHNRVECYHIQTALNYILRKKFNHALTANHMLCYKDDDGGLWLIGTSSGIPLFVQFYRVGSSADMIYYMVHMWQTFFQRDAHTKFLFLSSHVADIKEVIDFFKQQNPLFAFRAMDTKVILQTYGILHPPYNSEHLFLLLFLSLCEL